MFTVAPQMNNGMQGEKNVKTYVSLRVMWSAHRPAHYVLTTMMKMVASIASRHILISAGEDASLSRLHQ
jgi:hypothetical protein